MLRYFLVISFIGLMAGCSLDASLYTGQSSPSLSPDDSSPSIAALNEKWAILGTVRDITTDSVGGQVFVGNFMGVISRNKQQANFAIIQDTPTFPLKDTFHLPGSFSPNADPVYNSAKKIIRTDDGKYLVGGEFVTFNDAPSPSLIRLNADGSLDASFHAQLEGVTTSVNDFLVQPDGKIVVAAKLNNICPGQSNPCPLLRINTDGSLDTQFIANLATAEIYNQAQAVALDSQNNIYVVGSFQKGIQRILPTGFVDSSFNVGTGFTGFPNITLLHVFSDDSVIVGGSLNGYQGNTAKNIAMINNDGSFKGSFAQGTGFNGALKALTITPDNKILALGSFTNYNGSSRTGIAKINLDGTLDTSFNPNLSILQGFAATYTSRGTIFAAIGVAPWGEYQKLVELDSTGEILLDPGYDLGRQQRVTRIQRVGSEILVNGGFRSVYPEHRLESIGRMKPDGTLDTNFAPAGGADWEITKVIATKNNNYIIYGNFEEFGGQSITGLALLSPTGTLLNSSGLDSGNIYFIRELQSSPQKFLILGGMSSYNGHSVPQMFALNEDGSLDNAFNSLIDGNAIDFVDDVTVTENFIYLSIYEPTEQYNSETMGSLMRLSKNGVRDSSFSTVSSNLLTSIGNIVEFASGDIAIVGSENYQCGGTDSYRMVVLTSTGACKTTFGTRFDGIWAKTIKTSDQALLVTSLDATDNGVALDAVFKVSLTGVIDNKFRTASTWTVLEPNDSYGFNFIAIPDSTHIAVYGNFTTALGENSRRLAIIDENVNLVQSFPDLSLEQDVLNADCNFGKCILSVGKH